jgi:hypothetical protein
MPVKRYYYCARLYKPKTVLFVSMKKLSLVLAMGVAIMSCSKKNDAPAPYLNFNQTALVLPPVPGATADLIVESNIEWNVSAGADWLQLSKTSGKGNDTIHISVSKDNEGAQPRTTIISAVPANSSISLQAQLTIEQKPYNIQLLSQKTFGGTADDYISAIIPTSDGGLFMAGHTYSNKNGDVGANHGSSDAWLVKLNSNRDTVWTRVMGGANYDAVYAATATADGGFALAGYTNSDNSGDIGRRTGNSDSWIIKLKSNGDTAWTRMLGTTAQYSYAYSIAATGDGGFIVAGEAGPGSDYNVMVVKLNSNGDVVWQKSFGGTSYDYCGSVNVAANGDILLAAYTRSNNSGHVGLNHGAEDAWIIRLNANGNMLWNKVLGGDKGDYAFGIHSTADGGCIVAGSTESNGSGNIGKTQGNEDLWVFKLDANGSIVWNSLFGGTGSEAGGPLAATPDGGYLIAGYSNSTDGDVGATKGGDDLWVVKLNSNGRKLWSKTFGGSSHDNSNSISLNADGSFIICGDTESNNSGDVGVNRGMTDTWLLKVKDY